MESRPNEPTAVEFESAKEIRLKLLNFFGNAGHRPASIEYFIEQTIYPMMCVALRQAHERGARENSAKAWDEGHSASCEVWPTNACPSHKNPYTINSSEPPRGE